MAEEAISVVFYGTPAYSLPTLESLINHPGFKVVAVVTQPDRPAERGQALQQSAVKQLAIRHSIPVLQPERLKKEKHEFIARLRQIESDQQVPRIDCAVVIAYGQIIPIEVLNLPKHGSLNLHASLLPRWRGAAPIQRAILAGDSETGVCLMQMEAGLDTGAVFSSISTTISSSDDAGTLHDRLAQLSAQLIIRDLKKIVLKQLTAVPQSDTGVTYAHKIDPKEARINWSLTSEQLLLQIRGFSPYPGAYTILNGKRLKIFSATAKPAIAASSGPGAVSFVDANRLEISTANGVLALGEVQYEGKRRMATAEFLRGAQIRAGAILE